MMRFKIQCVHIIWKSSRNVLNSVTSSPGTDTIVSRLIYTHVRSTNRFVLENKNSNYVSLSKRYLYACMRTEHNSWGNPSSNNSQIMWSHTSHRCKITVQWNGGFIRAPRYSTGTQKNMLLTLIRIQYNVCLSARLLFAQSARSTAGVQHRKPCATWLNLNAELQRRCGSSGVLNLFILRFTVWWWRVLAF
jgi:hypothetical protein